MESFPSTNCGEGSLTPVTATDQVCAHLPRARHSAKHTTRIIQANEGHAVVAPFHRWEK